MKSFALLIGLFVVLVGIVGMFAPERLVNFGRDVLTPGGIYAIAAFRIFVGLVLFLFAPASRWPKTLRAFGVIALVGGLVTPLVGADRSRAILEWESAQGTIWIRLGAGLALVLGGFLAFAVATSRNPKSA